MKLESFIEVVKDLVYLYDEDTAFAVYDREKLLAYSNTPKLNFHQELGRQIPKGGAAEEALRTGKRVMRLVSKEVLGLPFIGISNPIREENGEIVGVIATSISIEKINKLINIGQNLFAATQTVTANAETVSDTAEELATTVRNMNLETTQVMTNIERTRSITDQISKISAQSKILGINASIEAARAKGLGNGFFVVANEIGKLAEGTKYLNHDIIEVLNDVRTSVYSLIESLKQLAEVSDSQSVSTRQLTNTISSISKTAEHLLDMANLK